MPMAVKGLATDGVRVGAERRYLRAVWTLRALVRTAAWPRAAGISLGPCRWMCSPVGVGARNSMLYTDDSASRRAT